VGNSYIFSKQSDIFNINDVIIIHITSPLWETFAPSVSASIISFNRMVIFSEISKLIPVPVVLLKDLNDPILKHRTLVWSWNRRKCKYDETIVNAWVLIISNIPPIGKNFPKVVCSTLANKLFKEHWIFCIRIWWVTLIKLLVVPLDHVFLITMVSNSFIVFHSISQSVIGLLSTEFEDVWTWCRSKFF